MPQQLTPSAEELLGRIQQHVWLVSLTIGWPKLRHQIGEAEVVLDKEKLAEEFRTAPQWRLIPEEWEQKLGNVESRARRTLASASVQFAAKGSSLLPISKAEEVFQNLRTLRTEFYQVRDEFCLAYSKILHDVRAKLGDELFAHASAKLPSNDQIRGKFRMDWAIIPLAGASGPPEEAWEKVSDCITVLEEDHKDNPDAVVAELREAFNALRGTQWSQFDNDQLLLDVVREAKQNMAKMVSESIEAMVHEPRQEVAAAVQNMLDAIKEERTIRQGTLDQITRAFDKLKGFSFVADNDLMQQIKTMETRLQSLSPKDLNNSRDTGLQLAGALRPLLSAVTDEVRAAKAGNSLRRVRVFKPIEEPAAT